jgi:nucleoid-associated protein YgaU
VSSYRYHGRHHLTTNKRRHGAIAAVTLAGATGDTLSAIATQHDVDGGWRGLYQRNRGVVGDNPNLIFPGQRLTL